MPDALTIKPKQLSAFPMVLCAISTRLGGVSPEPLGMNLSYSVGDDPRNVDANRERFFRLLNVSGEQLAIPKQCHSATVRRADAPGSYPETDGLLTNKAKVWLVVSVADCTPVFVFDSSRHVVAALHAGWRGSLAGIVRRGIAMMETEFDSKPEDLYAFIGPSAGPCCYVVGPEVSGQFDPAVVTTRNGDHFLDIKAESKRQLLDGGIPENQIEVSEDCTICDDQFHSYRRDKSRSGRMMGVIGLKG